MFGSIGGPEFLLIAVLALLLFGPRKLPQIGKSLGRALAEFRGATHEFKSSLQREVELEELRDAKDGLQSIGRDLKATVNEVTRPVERSESPSGDSGPTRDDAPPRNGESPTKT
jgi:TatA/E family protein of Tat protein translocase